MTDDATTDNADDALVAAAHEDGMTLDEPRLEPGISEWSGLAWGAALVVITVVLSLVTNGLSCAVAAGDTVQTAHPVR